MKYSSSNPLVLTDHAKQRVAQRCISNEALQMVLDYGDETAAGNGCISYFLSKKIANDLASDMPDTAAVLAEACNLRAIVSSIGELVTCYHFSQRFLRAHKRRSRTVRRKRSGH